MRLALLVVAFAGGAACNQNTINTPIRSFDRPSDVALSCLQLNGTLPVAQQVYDAHPLSDCAPERITPLTIIDAAGVQYPPQLRAMVVNSARGELAEVDITNGILVDLFRQVPGFGFLPVGGLPQQVRVSADGCGALTANADSCDLALVDLSTLYNMPFVPFRDGGVVDDGGTSHFADNVVRRLVPTVNGVPLGARPTWIEFAPESVPGLHGFEAGGTTGQCTGSAYRAWVALPGCQLVVEVDLTASTPSITSDAAAPAEVVAAVRVTRNGAEVVSNLSSLSCPAECAGAAGASAVELAADAGVATNRLPMTQALPGAFALDSENSVGRLFIADQAGERVDIIPFDPTPGTLGGQLRPPSLGAPRALQLEAGAVGVSRLRVSPRSAAGKFLYAVARDASVRVVDLDREAECETNPDPRAFDAVAPTDPPPDPRRLGCFPLGDPSTPPRSPLASSPGIQLPGSALPRDVAFTHLDIPPPPTDTTIVPLSAGPLLPVGDFAWIVSSDGRGTLINLYDACPAPNVPQAISGGYTPVCDSGNIATSRSSAQLNPGSPQPLVLDLLAHRIRPETARFLAPTSPQDTAGAPRLQDPNTPFSVTVNGTPETAVVGAFDAGVAAGASGAGAPLDGGVVLDGAANPDLSAVTTTVPLVLPAMEAAGGPLADRTPRYLNFFDPDRVRNETWSLSWEGVLPGTARALGRPTAGALTDPGGAFCTHGVLAGDKLELTGCNTDTDCDFAQQCVRDPGAPVDVTNGLCLNRANVNAQAQACSPLLRAVRAYRITSAKQGVSATGQVLDGVTLAEIYEPDHAVETIECDPTNAHACDGILIPGTLDVSRVIALPTTCLADVDGKHRCLRACGDELGAAVHTGSGSGAVTLIRTSPGGAPSAATITLRIVTSGALGVATFEYSLDGQSFTAGGATASSFALPNIGVTLSFVRGGSEPSFVAGDVYVSTVVPFNDLCGLDFQCLPSQIDGSRRCLRSPLSADLFATCLLELQPYQIRVGDAFLVSGSLSGVFVDVQPDPTTFECHVPATGTQYTRLHQARIPLPAPACPPVGDALAALPIGVPNACQLEAGGTNAGVMLTSATNRVVHFENPLFSMLVSVPGASLAPSPTSVLSFVLVGGGIPLSTALATDVQAQQPVSAVTSPDRDSVFVVDEGKQTTATGLRGQLLKLSTSAESVDRRFQVR